jgi:hypothetical protein
MSSAASESLRAVPYQGDDWRAAYPPPAPSRNYGGPSLLLTGLVIAGLGFMAWNFLGPDIRRYLKIRAM